MSERIRVARVITRLNIGGPAIQATLLTGRLDPRRYASMLVCGTPGEREGDLLELRDLRELHPIVIPALGREISPLRDLSALVRLYRLFRRERPHVVHTHMAKAGLLGRLAARLAGVPVVVHTFHGNVFRAYFGGGPSRLFIALERLLARLSTRIVTIGPQQTEEIVRLGIARGEKVVEIPLGFELEPFLRAPSGSLRAELDVAPDAPLVGIVARLVPIKRVDAFIEAAALVAAVDARVTFVVVGDGELREELEALVAQRRLADRVRFLGWRADLAPIYADLDVVALTSANEGTPVSLIEAMASGRAVVATDVGGVPDLLGRGERGVLVPPGDSAALAGAVRELLADPDLRRRLGAAGREHALREHDARALLERIDGLYTHLIAGMAGERSAAH